VERVRVVHFVIDRVRGRCRSSRLPKTNQGQLVQRHLSYTTIICYFVVCNQFMYTSDDSVVIRYGNKTYCAQVKQSASSSIQVHQASHSLHDRRVQMMAATGRSPFPARRTHPSYAFPLLLHTREVSEGSTVGGETQIAPQ